MRFFSDNAAAAHPAVIEAIERLGYSPNRAARNLRTRTSHLIGLRVEPAVEDSANALMDRFLHSLVESSKDAGYHVLLFSSEGYVDEATVIPEEFFTQLLGRMSVPGAQLFGTTNPDGPTSLHAGLGLPRAQAASSDRVLRRADALCGDACLGRIARTRRAPVARRA